MGTTLAWAAAETLSTVEDADRRCSELTCMGHSERPVHTAKKAEQRCAHAKMSSYDSIQHCLFGTRVFGHVQDTGARGHPMNSWNIWMK